MKILAVDDDLHILELLTMMAARAGFTDILTASSGEIALDMLNEGDTVFDCLLLDISMPGMDGIELCGLTRAIPAYNKTPIIMLTAMSEKDYIDRAFRAGATDYATKPFDIVELHARLRMAEELGKARQEAIQSSTKTEVAQSTHAHEHPFALSDEVAIEGVKDLIGYTALVNYLTQLSLAGVAGSQVVAIKIDHIKTIYVKASTEEFLYALTETADVISNILKTDGYMMAYAGNGTFVAVWNKATLETSAGLEAEIQNLLDGRDTEYDNGDTLDIEASVGNPLQPSASRTQRVRKTFDRAIARAENRALRKHNEPRPPNIRLVGG